MSKIPSRKFSTAKRKIATSQRKIASGKIGGSTAAKIPTRKFAQAKRVAKQKPMTETPLDRPSDEQSRQEVVAILKNRLDALKARGKR